METVVETNVEGQDPSFEELENYLSPSIGISVETPKPVTVPPTSSEAPSQKPEPVAAAVETPVAEPGKKQEGEEIPPTPTQEPAVEDGAPKPKKHDINVRLSSLAQKRREAEAREREANQNLEQERAKTERLQRELETLRSGHPGPNEPAADGKPTTQVQPAAGDKFAKIPPSMKDFTKEGGKFYKEDESFEDAVDRYQQERDAWRDEKRQFEDQIQARSKADVDFRQSVQQDLRIAMEEHPDFEDARDYLRSNSSDGLQVAVSHLPRFSKEKPAWTEVVVYLADNPDVLDALNDQFSENQIGAIAQLGVIWNSLKPVERKQAPAARTATPTRVAPSPPVAVGGGSAPAPVNLEEADMMTFATEMAKYGIK